MTEKDKIFDKLLSKKINEMHDLNEKLEEFKEKVSRDMKH
jgi:hypothetical protein